VIAVVRPGTVTDTSRDGRHRPFRVDVVVSEPVVGLGEAALHLDGPLSWCAHQQAEVEGMRFPPVTPEWICDFTLPLATWTRPGPPRHPKAAAADGGTWGWCGSRGRWTPAAHTAVQTRRMPHVEAHARFTAARRFHAGLGPTKARNTIAEAVRVWRS